MNKYYSASDLDSILQPADNEVKSDSYVLAEKIIEQTSSYPDNIKRKMYTAFEKGDYSTVYECAWNGLEGHRAGMDGDLNTREIKELVDHFFATPIVVKKMNHKERQENIKRNAKSIIEISQQCYGQSIITRMNALFNKEDYQGVLDLACKFDSHHRGNVVMKRNAARVLSRFEKTGS